MFHPVMELEVEAFCFDVQKVKRRRKTFGVNSFEINNGPETDEQISKFSRNMSGLSGLHRSLLPRHLSMIAIGGTLGSGLFIGSGSITT